MNRSFSGRNINPKKNKLIKPKNKNKSTIITNNIASKNKKDINKIEEDDINSNRKNLNN